MCYIYVYVYVAVIIHTCKCSPHIAMENALHPSVYTRAYIHALSRKNWSPQNQSPRTKYFRKKSVPLRKIWSPPPPPPFSFPAEIKGTTRYNSHNQNCTTRYNLVAKSVPPLPKVYQVVRKGRWLFRMSIMTIF